MAEPSEPTRMDKWREERSAYYWLEEAMLEALGFDCDAKPPWPYGRDWFFDDYDHSVELVGAEPSARFTKDQAKKLCEAGIYQAWVSYSDGTAEIWNLETLEHGSCSPREVKTDKRDQISELKKQLQSARKAGYEQCREEAARVVEALMDSGHAWTGLEAIETIRSLEWKPDPK